MRDGVPREMNGAASRLVTACGKTAAAARDFRPT
jgi:hypothetical protein